MSTLNYDPAVIAAVIAELKVAGLGVANGQVLLNQLIACAADHARLADRVAAQLVLIESLASERDALRATAIARLADAMKGPAIKNPGDP